MIKSHKRNSLTILFGYSFGCLRYYFSYPSAFSPLRSSQWRTPKHHVNNLKTLACLVLYSSKAARCQNIYVAPGTSETDNMPGSQGGF